MSYFASRVRFVPYDRLDDTPNLVVDGAADADTVLTLALAEERFAAVGQGGPLRRDVFR